MYHIKDDKRAQRSAKLITQGLNQCLLKKEYQKITVADILKEATVGRATFYRLFDSINDVLVYECDLMFRQINIDSNSDKTPQTIMLLDIETFMRHDLLLEAIVNSQQISIIYKAQRRQIENNSLFKYESLTDSQQDFYLSTLTYLLVSTLTTWIKHDKKESAKELFTILQLSVKMLYKTIRNPNNKN